MNLQCRIELGSAYKAGSQIARVLSEDWCERELYCAACDSSRLSSAKVNTPAVDFVCPRCAQPYQLKSLRKLNPRKIVDAGYDSMLRAIRSDKVPNLLVLHYSGDWLVRNLLVIPSALFSETAIERRVPLSPRARRAGWVGCNILLDRIPSDGKIAMVADGCAVPEDRVRKEFSRVKKLAEIPPTLRGWALDVLTTIRKLAKPRFSLQELYQLEPYLQSMHPLNRNVRPKIRQQLQVLRNLGLLEFTSPGSYTIRS